MILLLYYDDIVLLARYPYDLDKHLTILKYLCFSMGMTVNIYKTKVIIINFKKITYIDFVYGNKSFEEVKSYKYLGIDFHHKLNWNYNTKKMISEGWKLFWS